MAAKKKCLHDSNARWAAKRQSLVTNRTQNAAALRPRPPRASRLTGTRIWKQVRWQTYRFGKVMKAKLAGGACGVDQRKSIATFLLEFCIFQFGGVNLGRAWRRPTLTDLVDPWSLCSSCGSCAARLQTPDPRPIRSMTHSATDGRWGCDRGRGDRKPWVTKTRKPDWWEDHFNTTPRLILGHLQRYKVSGADFQVAEPFPIAFASTRPLFFFFFSCLVFRLVSSQARVELST